MRVIYSAIFHNLIIKITALILALLIWSYIAGQLYMQSPEAENSFHTSVELSDTGVIVKKLPVHVNITGTPNENYKVAAEKIKIRPSECIVTGPLEKIENLSSVTTEPISVENAMGSIKQKINLKEISGCTINKERGFYVIIPIVRKGVK